VQLGSPDDFLCAFPDTKGTFDVGVAFITHSSMDEGCSAWLAAAALTALIGGVLLDESSGEHIVGDEAIAWGRDVEKEVTR